MVEVIIKIFFGLDQKKIVISILDEMKDDGEVIEYSANEDIDNKYSCFSIRFKSPYHCYLFGYKQGKAMPVF